MRLAERAAHVRARRRHLASQLGVWRQFAQWEETCVPSYCHPNPAAAAVSWWRLFAAAELASRFVRGGPVLDFGAATGELAYLLPASWEYHFVEQQENAATYLAGQHPAAVRHTLDDVAPGRYAAVFALDSLEHNRDFEPLLARLAAALRPDGVLVLSGPTESALYRLGRRIAGFDAHYHETDIWHIEEAAARLLDRRAVRGLPPLVPLFRISVWSVRGAGR